MSKRSNGLSLRIVVFFFLSLQWHWAEESAPLRILIVDGQNNHDWQATTDSLRATLLATGRFEVSVETAPKAKIHFPPREPRDASAAELERFRGIKESYDRQKRLAAAETDVAFNQWRPRFSEFDAVLLNYNGRSWPSEVQTDFVRYVQGGGGLVLVHAANNGFREWSEFNEMIGLGYNGHRGLPTDRPVTCSHWNEKTETLDSCCPDENSGHGSQHAFVVKIRSTEHPIMRGLPTEWMHAKDELYHRLRGVGKNMTVLSSAWSDPAQRGTGRHEPLTWTVNYGSGRVVQTTMGHFWPRQDYWDSLHCVGFQTILARSVEFSATGRVTIPVPEQFPRKDQPSIVPPHQVKWNRHQQANQVSANWRQRKENNPFVMLTPEEEKASFQLPDGFVAELVASEPMVQEPVLAVWDGNGAMYVAEMRSYMQDEKGTGTKELRNGRIKKLIDTDGDGRMDRATVFVDGLNLPRMILPLDDRIAVVETDNTSVWAYRDLDHDGISDEKELLFQGRQGAPTRSVEHQDSGLIWNLDNWIYLSYNHTRYRFTDGTWRAEKTPSVWAQWGLAHDDIGRLFYSDNSKPALSIQVPRTYWNHIVRRTGRMPKYTPTIGLPYDHEFLNARNLSSYDDRGGKASPVKQFTSICGQEVFRGDALPHEAYGNYFFCDPTIHVVRRANIENQNGKIFLSRADGEDEFLISPDINFRPVSTHTGPDGCLYVVDMYRGIIQDAPWLSPGPREFIRKSGLAKNNQHGRIWRIRHRDHQPRTLPRMQDESTAELIRHFENRNGWWRDTAQKLILLRKDRESVAPLLEGLVRYDHHAPLVRLHALWTLEGMGLTDQSLLNHVLEDRDWRLRAAALRISEPAIREGNGSFIKRLESLTDDPEPELVKQLILSLGYSDSDEANRIIESAIKKHLTHDGIYLAGMAALWGKETALIQSMRDGSAFAAITDEEERIPVTKRWIEGIESWKRQDLKLPKEFTSHQKWLIGHGETIFYETCRSCHGPNGKGQQLPGTTTQLAPPLQQSPRVLGHPEKLIRIVLHGLTGPVDGKTYDAGTMPPIASLGYDNPNRIAQAVNYLRFAWGHELPPIDVDLVKKVQADTENRNHPWTIEELNQLDL